MTADPNANYIEHCHWLLALPLSVTSTHLPSSRPWRVILSGYANCDRRSELYRTLSLVACASAKCHPHPLAQQSAYSQIDYGKVFSVILNNLIWWVRLRVLVVVRVRVRVGARVMVGVGLVRG